MEEQKRGISVARLIDRERFYKEKALRLEKNFIFANERISALEEEVRTLTQAYEAREKEYHDVRAQFDQIKALYETLKEDYAKETANNQQLTEELLQYKNRFGTDADRNALDEKVKGFERLLNDMQREINEKDRELNHYRKRVTILEKRLKLHAATSLNEPPSVEAETMRRSDVEAIAYMDYALIDREPRAMVRGNLTIENKGSKALSTPYICFRFNPGDAAILKGRIKTWETVETEINDRDHWEWVYLDNDWAKEAKERGELWIAPTAPFAILPGERVELNDWQIPIERRFYEHLTVEVFVFFEKNDYRIKGVNKIALNF